MNQPPSGTVLAPPVLRRLRRGCAALVLSVDADGYARSTYSWVVAVGPGTLRFGVDRGKASSANLLRDGRACLQVVGTGGFNLLLRGPVYRLPSNSPALAEAGMEAWQLCLRQQHDQGWPGVRTNALRYRATVDDAGLRDLQARVLAELTELP